jgi:ComF family protein
MRKVFDHILDFFFPRICVACRKNHLGTETNICIECLVNIPKTNSHIKPVELIERKFWGKLHVKQTFSFLKFSKKGKVQNIIHALKYKNKPELAEFIGKMYAFDLKEAKIEKNIDILMGIPLHKDRLKVRGYNQADMFAKGLSEVLNLPYSTNALKRNTFTISQTKTSSRFKRHENIKDVFEVIDTDQIKNKRIALVDDVLTTGSTLEAVGNLLLGAGCKELYIITIASAY